VRPICDLRLFDDAGGPFKRMGKTEQTLDGRRAVLALLEVEHAARELIQ
jgi:hypothetical protein